MKFNCYPSRRSYLSLFRTAASLVLMLGLAAIHTRRAAAFQIAVRPTLTTRFPAMSPTRLYSRNEDGFLSKITNSAKRLFGQDEASIERKKARDSVTGNLQEILRDAPMPVRMLGQMITPLVGGVLTSAMEAASSQQELVSRYYQQAAVAIENDPLVSNALGGPVKVGQIMSQSSSSSSINGQSSTRIEIAFPVMGQFGQGFGRLFIMEQPGRSQEQLQVEVNGRVIPVSLDRASGGGYGGGRSGGRFGGNDGPVIEADIIDKRNSRF